MKQTNSQRNDVNKLGPCRTVATLDTSLSRDELDNIERVIIAILPAINDLLIKRIDSIRLSSDATDFVLAIGWGDGESAGKLVNESYS